MIGSLESLRPTTPDPSCTKKFPARCFLPKNVNFMENNANKYKNDDSTKDLLQMLKDIAEGKPLPEDLRRKRSTKGGLFSLDPETHTLYFILLDKYDLDFPLYLGDTQNYRMAELLVNQAEQLLTHKEIYEHIFNRTYEDALEPDKELRYFINRFKKKLQKKWKLKPLLKIMFESNYGRGYTLHNKM